MTGTIFKPAQEQTLPSDEELHQRLRTLVENHPEEFQRQFSDEDLKETIKVCEFWGLEKSASEVKQVLRQRNQ